MVRREHRHRRGCTSPAGPAGTIEFVPAENVHKYCDGTNWNLWAGRKTTGDFPSGSGLGTNWSDLVNVPAGLGDGDDDTLAGLGCTTDQIAVHDGSGWVCSDNA